MNPDIIVAVIMIAMAVVTFTGGVVLTLLRTRNH